MNDLLKQVDQPLDDSTRLIPLTKGRFATVDAADYEWLMQWKWHVIFSGLHYYAARRVGKGPYFLMHREIANTPIDKCTDHINRNTLDNTRANLRNCTKSQNGMNRQKQKDNKSGYKGVSWSRRGNRWTAQICIKGRQTYLGYFDEPKDAALAYNKMARKHFGKFAVLNDI